MRNMILCMACAMLLSACGDKGGASGQAEPALAVTPTEAAIDEGASPATPVAVAGASASDVTLLDNAGNAITLLPFDIADVPLATSALIGELPFFSLPEGYQPRSRAHQRAHARFPFRLGDGLHWVEGPSWNASIEVDSFHSSGKQYSALELRRNLEAVLEQAGAKQVFQGPLLRGLYYGPQLEHEIGGGFIDAVNLHDDSPTTVHVIRQADRNIWVQLSSDAYASGLVVVEERPFVPGVHWSNDFPHLPRLPGYDNGNRTVQRDFDAYPFWTGEGFENVEGRIWAAQVQARDGFHSMHEVRRALQAMMDEAGGIQLFEGRIPQEAAERITFEQKSPYSDATGFGWGNHDTLIYRIDLADGREVWIHARLEYNDAGWVVAERKALVQTAALLPANALKQRLDADGRVAIEVNFAMDKADILPQSQPQIEQVLALLQGDASLALSVEGHADDTGTVEHNRGLSEARARSVVTALTAKGIDAARLSAVGFGQDRPLADNGSEQGRAKNRRVELVKR